MVEGENPDFTNLKALFPTFKLDELGEEILLLLEEASGGGDDLPMIESWRGAGLVDAVPKGRELEDYLERTMQIPATTYVKFTGLYYARQLEEESQYILWALRTVLDPMQGDPDMTYDLERDTRMREVLDGLKAFFVLLSDPDYKDGKRNVGRKRREYAPNACIPALVNTMCFARHFLLGDGGEDLEEELERNLEDEIGKIIEEEL